MSSYASSRAAPLPTPQLGERVIDQVRDHAIFMLDSAGRMASWNLGIRHVFGYEEHEWIGQPASVIFLPEDVASGAPVEELQLAARTGKADDDRWLRRNDGSRMYGVGTVSRVQSDDGATVGFLKVVRDYTVMRRAEEERENLLREQSAARERAAQHAAALTAAVDAIPDALFISDGNSITRCNQTALHLLQATNASDLQLDLEQFAQKFRMRFEAQGPLARSEELPLSRALAGEASAHEIWATTREGRDIFIRSVAAPIVLDEKIVGMVAVNTDLTERLKLEERQNDLKRVRTILGARDQELRALVEGVRDYAIFTIDPAGMISSWHKGAEMMKGYTSEEAVGMPFANLFRPEDRAIGKPEKEMAIAAEAGEYKGEGHRMRKNGELFEASVVLTALKGERGELLGYLKLTQDITARRAQERNQEESLRSAEAARAHAERASASMSEFLATISHELRTPLSAILSWASVLSRKTTSPTELQRGVSAISRNAKAQISLVEDLLDVNRIETGNLRLDMQPVALATVIAAAQESVLPALDAKRIRLKVSLEPSVGLVMGDAARLQQIIWNLLTNAAKFTAEGGHVSVGLRQDGDHVEVSVKDDGQGIDSTFLPFVFTRFRQQDASSTRRHGGLGLGLTIVKQLTELHGGLVSVDSGGSGKGSTFTVSIPSLTESSAAPPAPLPSPSAPLDTSTRLDGATVVVVEDEEDVREATAHILADAGAKVLSASNAEAGLALVKSCRPDVVLSDIGMPLHDGFELIHWIRALDERDGGLTPAVAFTAFAGAADRKRLLDAGFVAVLVKPVELDALVATVAAQRLRNGRA